MKIVIEISEDFYNISKMLSDRGLGSYIEQCVAKGEVLSERDCKTCKHSNNGRCAYTETCHECMWESQYEQEPCEDAISRHAVKDWFCTNYCSEHNKCEHFEKGDCNSMNELYSLPFVTPQPKTGRWIKNEGSLYCSFCGCGALYDKVYPGESVFGKTIRVDSTFCPTCGAKMTAESEENNE